MAKALKDMTAPEIGELGEKEVLKDLQARGYVCSHDTKGAGSTDIEAVKSSGSFLIQVKTCCSPGTPAELSPDETRNIKSRAAKKTGFTANIAQVVISENKDGNISSTIKYKAV